MQRTILIINLLLLMTSISLAQDLSMKLTVSDNAGGSQELFFGLDTGATNGLDSDLGENELPPLPPTGIFEARFIGDDIDMSELGLGSYQDYRSGDSGFEGTVTHEIKYQAGSSGSLIQISWNFPVGVTAALEDLFGGAVVNETMRDSGRVTVTNLAVDKLKMTVTYTGVLTSVESSNTLTPDQFQLFQNYPNPFNPSTQITYSLSYDTQVRLSVYNLLGQEVSLLVDQFQEAGLHMVTFKPNDLSSGIYLYKIQAGDFSATRKLMFVK